MNLILKNTDFLATGIFGTLEDEAGTLFLYTLQHAYAVQADGVQGSTSWAPKLPPGVYQCVRGMHNLAPTVTHPKPSPFSTFEVQNVPGHSGILFHTGNEEGDSSGCILLGADRNAFEVLHSQLAFEAFMNAEDSIAEFTLTVS